MTGSDQRKLLSFVTIGNAKLVAMCLVTGLTIYHGFLHREYGNSSCKWMLNDGRFHGYDTRQPYGCMIHNYTSRDVRGCLNHRSSRQGRHRITFLGDGRVRALYQSVVGMVTEQPTEKFGYNIDMTFTDDSSNTSLDFLWFPVHTTRMFDVYGGWVQGDPRSRPSVLIAGSATRYMGSQASLESYKANLTIIAEYAGKLRDSTEFIWIPQEPVLEDKLDGTQTSIKNDYFATYNKVAYDVLSGTHAKIWSSCQDNAGISSISTDHRYLSHHARTTDTQIFMNFYCNNDMQHKDGTCCRNPEQTTFLQVATAAFFLICVAAAIAIHVYRRRMHLLDGNDAKTGLSVEEGHKSELIPTPLDKTQPIYEVLTSLAKLGIIMSFFFLCDRADFFMKTNKHYSHLEFILPLSVVTVLGLVFSRSSDKFEVLHRDQTDEWKGWMQLVILIYHITGASKELVIYMHIRVLVSSYLFMTGFGHFTFFWKKADYGLARFLQVMFRLNLLTVVLCFVMNRPYQFYYFVPLVSFWFVVLYVTMAMWPRVSETTTKETPWHHVLMILKFVLLLSIITLFYMSESLFEKVFLLKPLSSLFVTSDGSIHEWRFRWWLDRFSVVYGMLFAGAYQLLKRCNLIQDTGKDNVFSSRSVSLLTFALGIVGIACQIIVVCILVSSTSKFQSYAVFASVCNSKPECNHIHSYINFLPIVAFVLVRNVPGFLRLRYSYFFAWFGKISLELFISQYHVWLAADTQGILVLVPHNPLLNVVVTSFIFVCISHEISMVTATLAKYAVPKEWKALLRNAIVFALVLLPLWFTKA